MVKGISKRVIVVRTPISSMFDQAIFILNENVLCDGASDSENILREACAVADEYVRANCGGKTKHPPRCTFRTLLLSNAILFTVLTVIYLFLLR